jgi:exonuclease VII large subunit
MQALSPLAVLGRGYAVCLREGVALREAHSVRPGDQVAVILARGRLHAVVQRLLDDEEI